MIRFLVYLPQLLFIKLVRSRIFFVGFVFSILFGAIIVRLFRLQVIGGREYLDQYKESILKEVSTQGSRGDIYDINGNLLAYNELAYNITITDVDAYPANNSGINQRNIMYLTLARIIEKYGFSIDSKYGVVLDDYGEMRFSTTTPRNHRTFIANVYGRNVSDLDKGQNPKYPSNISAREAFEYSKNRYAFNKMKDEYGNPIVVSEKTMLDMIGIHYTMRLTSYQKYQTTTIASGVSRECAVEIVESSSTLKGVDVEETSVRRYNYAKYFAHIVGYVSAMTPEKLEYMKEIDPDYVYKLSDKIGVWGLEKSMESTLRGNSGYRQMYVNSSGSILDITKEANASAGSDVYTTISIYDQIAVYHLLEQQLAGIIASKIVNEEPDNSKLSSSAMLIAASDAFYQLIANNVLDYNRFSYSNAPFAQREIYQAFQRGKADVLDRVYKDLTDPLTPVLKNLPRDEQNYLVYIFEYLRSKDTGIFIQANVDKDSDEYALWKDNNISLRNYLLKGIEQNWIDITKIYTEEKYINADTIYQAMVNHIIMSIRRDPNFDKLIYKFEIKNKKIKRTHICMALYEQGVLKEDEVAYRKLMNSDDNYAYDFLIDKIQRIEITPAQLALDPCTGSVVITDIHSGKVKALVSYPSFDNNRVTEIGYLDKCNVDQSRPLVSVTTQQQLAPGSSFKPVTALAVLNEGKVTDTELYECTGEYKDIDTPIKCWAWPYSHGKLNIVGAIKNSCNMCFAEYGHRLGLEGLDPTTYSMNRGMALIAKYATMLGLSTKSGVELDESMPRISSMDTERSAMGQGTHAFNNAQLAKYTVALANSGTVYKLSIIEKTQDKKGNVLYQFAPVVEQIVDASENAWKTVRQGLREVVYDGIASVIFGKQMITVSGKTGTAEERNDRGNHAVFISYAPFEGPEIAVNVTIPFGYSSGNAASLASRVYDYCYGKISFDKVISQNAKGIKSISVSD